MSELVLNVDDFEPQLYIRSATLRAAGFRVLEARTGGEALRLVREEHPPLVLLDVHLPDITGQEVCRQIKADPATARTLVLHISATFVEPAVQVSALDNGADGYLVEPVGRDELVAHVRSLLRLARAEAERERAEKAGRETEERLRRTVQSETVERERSARAMRESEERLALALEAAGQAPWEMDLAGGRVISSPGLCRIHGLPDDAELHTFRDWGRFMLDEDRPRVADALALALAGGQYAAEYRIRRASDGAIRWIATVGTVLRDEMGRARRLIGVATDMTERKRAAEAQTRLAAIVASSDDAIVSKDLDGIVQTWNVGAERLLGYTPEEMIGKGISLLLPPERVEEEEEILQRLRAGQHVERLETVRVTKDGRRVDVSLTVSPLADPGGQIVGASTIMRDVTDRRKAEDTARRALEALRDANARLEEADRRKDEFIAILSHELRNPLAPIRYALPVLQAQPLPDDAARALGVIERQVVHLARLVDDLLDVSRISGDKIELRREQVTLASVVTAAIEGAAPALSSSRHSLTVWVAESPVWLLADAERLAQVVTNILNNSAKYTPPGGEIAVTAGPENGQAVIRVRDNGIGIPAEALPTVFEMFRQVEHADKPQGGLGVGLALAKRLVDLHGGVIEARSGGVGQGAEFIVRLPVIAGVEACPGGEDSGGRRAETARLRVLIVDDNADFVEMLGMMIEALGHDVRKTLDGPSAISAAASYQPDVILLDLGLPGLSGYQVARHLRQRPETASVRLVALTGWGQEEDRARTRDAGFDHHLTKPTDPDTLSRLLSELSQKV